MNYFYFDMFDGQVTLKDEVGLELSDVAAAVERGQEIAFSKVRATKARAEPIDPRELRIRISAGQCVAKIAFRYVLI
jgi:hypothetical protein